MKRLLLTVLSVAVFSSAGAALAQTTGNEPTSRPAAGMFHKRMMERRHMLCQKLNLTDEQKAKIRQIMKDARGRIYKEVLTDEQRAQVDKFREARKEAGLNLTDDQKAQVHKIMEKAKTDAAAATTPEAKREVWQKARQQIHDTVLTPEQRAKADQWRKEHPGPGGKTAAPTETPAPQP